MYRSILCKRKIWVNVNNPENTKSGQDSNWVSESLNSVGISAWREAKRRECRPPREARCLAENTGIFRVNLTGLSPLNYTSDSTCGVVSLWAGECQVTRGADSP